MNSGKSSIKKIIGNAVTALLTLIATASLFACIALAVDIPACMYFSGRTDKIFTTIQTGDTKDAVVAKLGTPTDIELSNGGPVIRGSSDCQGLCVERLRYYFPLCLGLDVWLVEFDQNHKVVAKYHEISP